MKSEELSKICQESLSDERYVFLWHRGVGRDVYPYEIKGGKLWCWCSLHPDRGVEGMWVENISAAQPSGNSIGLSFPYPSDFERE